MSVESIGAWFGLSYANYLVVPRTVLQSMPDEWQERFVACLQEIDGTFPDLDLPSYNVRCLKRAQELIYVTPPCDECDGSGRVGEDECERCDGMGDLNSRDDGDYRYETPEEVGFKSDPIPHYDRGRARIRAAA